MNKIATGILTILVLSCNDDAPSLICKSDEPLLWITEEHLCDCYLDNNSEITVDTIIYKLPRHAITPPIVSSCFMVDSSVDSVKVIHLDSKEYIAINKGACLYENRSRLYIHSKKKIYTSFFEEREDLVEWEITKLQTQYKLNHQTHGDFEFVPRRKNARPRLSVVIGHYEQDTFTLESVLIGHSDDTYLRIGEKVMRHFQENGDTIWLEALQFPITYYEKDQLMPWDSLEIILQEEE